MDEKFKATLKSSETEDWLDLHVIRPFCYYLAVFFAKFDVHPNTVTIWSMIIGAASAFFFACGSFYYSGMWGLTMNIIGIVLLISFFIGAVICIQMKLNIQSPWMPRWVSGYTTREIMLLEFSSSIMCLILAGKVGSNIASEIGTMRVTQQIDALEIMGVNSACYLILPKILGMITIMPLLVIFSSALGIVGAYGTAYIGGIIVPDDLTLGLQHDFKSWFMWMSIIKSLFFAFIISAVPSYCGYTVEGGSVNVGKASTDAVVTSSVLILCSDVFLTELLS